LRGLPQLLPNGGSLGYESYGRLRPMPMHRRRVYLDYGPSRKSRIEGWLSFSIYLSAAILLLSLLGCLPDVMSSTLRWLLPERLSDSSRSRFGDGTVLRVGGALRDPDDALWGLPCCGGISGRLTARSERVPWCRTLGAIFRLANGAS